MSVGESWLRNCRSGPTRLLGCDDRLRASGPVGYGRRERHGTSFGGLSSTRATGGTQWPPARATSRDGCPCTRGGRRSARRPSRRASPRRNRRRTCRHHRDLGAVSDVVLSAGRNSPKRTWADQSMDEVEAIITTNFTAVVRTVDVVLPDLRAVGGGQIIVVSSYSSWRFTPYAGVAYSASKSALLALCQTLNAQEAGNGIRACHLCPGDVDSDFLRFRPVVPNDEARSVMLSPEDVGRAVKFVLDSPSHVRIDELVLSPISQVS